MSEPWSQPPIFKPRITLTRNSVQTSEVVPFQCVEAAAMPSKAVACGELFVGMSNTFRYGVDMAFCSRSGG